MFETSNPFILGLVQKLTARGLGMRLLEKRRWSDQANMLHVEIHCEALPVAEAMILDMGADGYQLFIAPAAVTHEDDIEAVLRSRSDNAPRLQPSLALGD